MSLMTIRVRAEEAWIESFTKAMGDRGPTLDATGMTVTTTFDPTLSDEITMQRSVVRITLEGVHDKEIRK